MNSNDPDFNWHAAGIFIAVDRHNEPLLSSCSRTPHSSRSILLRNKNKPWSILKDLGWVIVEYEVKQ